jgi:hypothetical protein
MECVEGETLDRTQKRRGRLPVAEACEVVRQAALGLQHAHERGLVHRDLKPGNLMVMPEGQTKILDFGLAQFVRQRQEPGALTPEGALVGTPANLAPEQALDPRGADIRADLYSLGCTLYYLLAGHPPFPAGTVLQQLLAHQDQTPAELSVLRTDVPAALGRLVQRLLAKEPTRRLQTPGELDEALAPFAAGTGATVADGQARPRTSARWRRGVVPVLAGLLVLAGAGVGYLVLGGRRTEDAKLPDDKPGQPWSARPSAADQGVAWVRAHNSLKADALLVGDVRRMLTGVAPGRAFVLRLGRGLVRSGKATLLAGRHHDLAVFAFGPEQAGPWIPAETTVFYVTAPQSQEYAPCQLVSLAALRLTYVVGRETRTLYEVFDNESLAEAGTLKFSFPPARSRGAPGRAAARSCKIASAPSGRFQYVCRLLTRALNSPTSDSTRLLVIGRPS